jgi:hypothetical protein
LTILPRSLPWPGAKPPPGGLRISGRSPEAKLLIERVISRRPSRDLARFSALQASTSLNGRRRRSPRARDGGRPLSIMPTTEGGDPLDSRRGSLRWRGRVGSQQRPRHSIRWWSPWSLFKHLRIIAGGPRCSIRSTRSCSWFFSVCLPAVVRLEALHAVVETRFDGREVVFRERLGEVVLFQICEPFRVV